MSAAPLPNPLSQQPAAALERARRDLAAGRPDRARDRVHGFLGTLHRQGEYREEAYLLLGEILFEMKDRPRAGAAWLLTTRSGPDVEAALEAFHERYGRNGVNVLKAIKPRAPSERYPPEVQARLRAWGYRYRPYRTRSHPQRSGSDPEPLTGLRPIEIGCALIVLAFTLFAALYLLRVLGIV